MKQEFTQSKMCESREFCGRCLHSKSFRHNLSKAFRPLPYNFVCPHGVKPSEVPVIKEEVPVMEFPETFCNSCPAFVDGHCVHTGTKVPWKLRGCPINLWAKPAGEEPDTVTKVVSFFKFVKDSLAAGMFNFADGDVTEARLAICKECPFNVTGYSCNECGCNLKAKTLAEMTSCPRGFWPE